MLEYLWRSLVVRLPLIIRFLVWQDVDALLEIVARGWPILELSHIDNCISMNHSIISLDLRRMRSLLLFEMTYLVNYQLIISHRIICGLSSPL